MNALPSDLIRRTSELSEAVTQPIPGSRKIHVEGANGVRVPMREIVLGDTPKVFGADANPPFVVYDTSGPYTDDSIRIDLTAGLAALRAVRQRAPARPWWQRHPSRTRRRRRALHGESST